MTRVIWTPAALRDIARLYRFLAPKNRAAAQRAARTIREGAQGLLTHPEIGRPVEEMPPGLRERIVPFGTGGCVVLYHYGGAQVTILAVRHGKEAGY